MNAADIRAAILGANDLPTKDVTVDAWGVTVTVRALSAKARDQLQAAMAGDQSTSRFYAAVMAAGAVDDQGNAVFTADDVAALQEKQSGAVTQVAQAVLNLSGMGETTVDVAEKNSEAAPSGDSPFA